METGLDAILPLARPLLGSSPKETEMEEIAEFIRRVVSGKEDVERVKKDVVEFRKGFQRVHYCFEDAIKAYEYVKIR